MGILRDLFGGKVSGGKIDWDDLRKMMDYQADLNRFDNIGLFSGSEWSEGPDGKWTRQQTVNPALQAGLDRIMGRASNGMGDPYSAPSQFSQLLDAKMANQFQRHGLGQGGAAPDPATYGPPSASQPGRNPHMSSSAPPAQQATPQQAQQPAPAPGGGGGLFGALARGANANPQGGGMLGGMFGAGGGGGGGGAPVDWDQLKQMMGQMQR